MLFQIIIIQYMWSLIHYFLCHESLGPIIDQDALVEALKSGKIRAAALDVTDPEPLPRDHPLLSLSNVIITPHTGSRTVETRIKMVEQVIDNLKLGLEGKPMEGEIREDTVHSFLWKNPLWYCSYICIRITWGLRTPEFAELCLTHSYL